MRIAEPVEHLSWWKCQPLIQNLIFCHFATDQHSVWMQLKPLQNKALILDYIQPNSYVLYLDIKMELILNIMMSTPEWFVQLPYTQ